MKRLIFCGLMILICLPAKAQTDINRYTLFTGFDYMISPARNLTQRGFESDFGITVKPWLGLGADFGISGEDILTGAGTINGSETVFSPVLKNIQIDPNSIHVAFKSTTYTLAAGPQLYFRRFEKVTFFARPGFGLIHESANIAFPPQLGQLLGMLGQPIPHANQTDTTYFVGLGGGFDLNVSRRIGLRFAADWVNTHLFSNLLTQRQNYIRFSVGPTFRWGQLKQSR
jgi:hypothetical protein